jgi:hypothetical protein
MYRGEAKSFPFSLFNQNADGTTNYSSPLNLTGKALTFTVVAERGSGTVTLQKTIAAGITLNSPLTLGTGNIVFAHDDTLGSTPVPAGQYTFDLKDTTTELVLAYGVFQLLAEATAG